jgi:hypothetical protein
MGFSATIMSREEAMLLPVDKRPLCFRILSEIYTAVFESIGAASMCWSPKLTNQVFNSEQASKIATDLCFKIAETLESHVCPDCGSPKRDLTRLKSTPITTPKKSHHKKKK